MRVWVSTFFFLGVGALLLFIGVLQAGAAWPHASHSVAGDAVNVDTALGGLGRPAHFVMTLKDKADRFALVSLMLPHPTAGQLIDAAQVRIDYDTQAQLTAEGGGGSIYAVTGLTVDGRVYFTPRGYELMIALSALVVLLPGGVMFGVGLLWLSRLRVDPRWQPLSMRVNALRPYAPVLSLAGPSLRDPRKTADGHWLH
jgi:hypothetical protein